MKLNTVISLSTLYVVLFVISVYTLGDNFVTGTLFLFSPIMMIWLVLRILKDDYKESKTFEKYFYADKNTIRIRANQ
jgi:hypothetical protein